MRIDFYNLFSQYDVLRLDVAACQVVKQSKYLPYSYSRFPPKNGGKMRGKKEVGETLQDPLSSCPSHSNGWRSGLKV